MVLVSLLVASLLGLALVEMVLRHHRQMQVMSAQQQCFWLAEAAMERALRKLAGSSDYQGETWEVSSDVLGTARPAVVTIEVETVISQVERDTAGATVDDTAGATVDDTVGATVGATAGLSSSAPNTVGQANRGTDTVGQANRGTGQVELGGPSADGSPAARKIRVEVRLADEGRRRVAFRRELVVRLPQPDAAARGDTEAKKQGAETAVPESSNL